MGGLMEAVAGFLKSIVFVSAIAGMLLVVVINQGSRLLELNQTIDELERILAQLEQDYQSVLDENLVLADTIRDLDSANQELTLKFNNSQFDLEDVESQLVQQRGKISDLSTRNQDLEQRNSDLAEQNMALLAEVERLQQVDQDHVAEIEQLRPAGLEQVSSSGSPGIVQEQPVDFEPLGQPVLFPAAIGGVVAVTAGGFGAWWAHQRQLVKRLFSTKMTQPSRQTQLVPVRIVPQKTDTSRSQTSQGRRPME